MSIPPQPAHIPVNGPDAVPLTVAEYEKYHMNFEGWTPSEKEFLEEKFSAQLNNNSLLTKTAGEAGVRILLDVPSFLANTWEKKPYVSGRRMFANMIANKLSGSVGALQHLTKSPAKEDVNIVVFTAKKGPLPNGKNYMLQYVGEDKMLVSWVDFDNIGNNSLNWEEMKLILPSITGKPAPALSRPAPAAPVAATTPSVTATAGGGGKFAQPPAAAAPAKTAPVPVAKPPPAAAASPVAKPPAAKLAPIPTPTPTSATAPSAAKPGQAWDSGPSGPRLLSPANINADFALLVPEAKDDIGVCIDTELTIFDEWTTSFSLKFEAGEVNLRMNKYENHDEAKYEANVTRGRRQASKKGGGGGGGGGGEYKLWVSNFIKIVAEYYAEKVVHWVGLKESGNPVANAFGAQAPKELVTTLFQWSLVHDKYDYARKFLKMGADAKYYIAYNGSAEADPMYSQHHYPERAKGATGLHWACERPDAKALEVMKEAGAWDITAKDAGGRTPLHYLMTGRQYCAYPEKRIECLKLLVADPKFNTILNTKTDKGNTPINCLLAGFPNNYRLEEISQIIEAWIPLSPPDITIKADDGMDPLQKSIVFGWHQLAKLLEKAKQKPAAPAASAVKTPVSAAGSAAGGTVSAEKYNKLKKQLDLVTQLLLETQEAIKYPTTQMNSLVYELNNFLEENQE